MSSQVAIPVNIHVYLKTKHSTEVYDILQQALNIDPATVAGIIAAAGLNAKSKPDEWSTLFVSLFSLGRHAVNDGDPMPAFFRAWGDRNYPHMNDDSLAYETPAFGGNGTANEFTGVKIVTV